MPRKMSDSKYRDYRKFQRYAGELKKAGKSEAQIGAAARLPDERMASRKLRREAGGKSLLKPYTCPTCGAATKAKVAKGNMGQ